MRIATWNLQRPGSAASERGQALMRHMCSVDADIWVLTETRESIVPGDGYSSASTTGSDRKQSPGEQWSMIWSRLPVLSLETTCDPIRTVCTRLATRQSGSILVYGTVLPWRADNRWLPKRGGEAFEHVVQAQAEDWQRLRAKYPEDILCVAGDFNQELNKRSYAGTARGRAALRNALTKVSLRCLTGDDDDPIASQTLGVRQNIDHILVDARIDGEFGIRRGAWPVALSELRGLSDHFGVWVDIDALV